MKNLENFYKKWYNIELQSDDDQIIRYGYINTYINNM